LSSNDIQNIKKIAVGLQGGGSLGAYTAGVLAQIIADPTIEITDITGTSAGAMNGMVVVQTINKFGYDIEGRNKTIERLGRFWSDVSHPPLLPGVKETLNIMAAFNPHGAKQVITNSLIQQIEDYVINPRALASGRLINLTIPAVDDNGNERLFTNEQITHDAIHASAAIQPHIHPVTIDGVRYIDGAYIGGSNPPIEPLTKIFNDVDAILFIMTNPPAPPIHCRKQSDLSIADVLHTDNLILHQAYDHIALLLDQRTKGTKIPPIHMIWPNVARPYTQEQKQQVDSNFIRELYAQGIEDGRIFLYKHKKTLHTRSSLSLNGLKNKARNFTHYV
jgi:NTE family protein